MTQQYTIQQVAEITQVSAHTLRFYERAGLLEIARATNGHRRYSDSDIGWVRFILLLRATGMPLPQIADYMALEKDGQDTLSQRQQMLEDHRVELVQHITDLHCHLDALDRKIAHYRNPATESCD